MDKLETTFVCLIVYFARCFHAEPLTDLGKAGFFLFVWLVGIFFSFFFLLTDATILPIRRRNPARSNEAVEQRSWGDYTMEPVKGEKMKTCCHHVIIICQLPSHKLEMRKHAGFSSSHICPRQTSSVLHSQPV